MSARFLMVSPHTRAVKGDDKIFAINQAAQEAVKKVGAENVVNATIGALLDDHGKLSVLPTMIDLLKNLPPEEFAAYAPIGGVPRFLEAAKKSAFRDCFPEGYIEAMATPGGTGAIRNTIRNYSAPGDSILTSDWYWSPYHTIADEHDRKIETYSLFNEKNEFHLDAFEQKIDALLRKQEQLVILLNAPAHNPTGYSPSIDEWEAIMNILKKAVQNKHKKIILFVDAAYIDFAGETNECRAFMKYFSHLPQNILVIIGFSMSKSYTLYGMRSGAAIAISSSKEVVDEFKMISQYSNRGVWSNGTRPAMIVLAQVFENPDLLAKVDAERAAFSNLLFERANAFIENAKKVNLDICPYKAGFFITVPCENAEEAAKELQNDFIFAVPIGRGIRFAVSAVPKEKCAQAPEKFVKAIRK
jgi:aromatic-amino-acid transaminase